MTIYALDTTVTAISIASLKDDGTIGTAIASAPPEDKVSHAPVPSWQRYRAVAEEAWNLVMKRGDAELVVLSKQLWNTMDKDASAFRRAAVWWTLVEFASEDGVPVAEVPLSLVHPFLVDAPKAGGPRAGIMAETSKLLSEKLTFTARGAGFRAPVVGLPLIGGFLIGLEHAAFPITDNRAQLLSDRRYISVQYPPELSPVPSSLVEFQSLAGARKESAA